MTMTTDELRLALVVLTLLLTTGLSVFHSMFLIVRHRSVKTLSLTMTLFNVVVLVMITSRSFEDENAYLSLMSASMAVFALYHLIIAIIYFLYLGLLPTLKKPGKVFATVAIVLSIALPELVISDKFLAMFQEDYDIPQAIIRWSWSGFLLMLVGLGLQMRLLRREYKNPPPQALDEQGTGVVSLVKLLNAQLVTVVFAIFAASEFALPSLAINAVCFVSNGIAIWFFWKIKQREGKTFWSRKFWS